MTYEAISRREDLIGPLAAARRWHGRLLGSTVAPVLLFAACALGGSDHVFFRAALWFSVFQSVTWFLLTRATSIDKGALLFRKNHNAVIAFAGLWTLAAVSRIFRTQLNSMLAVTRPAAWPETQPPTQSNWLWLRSTSRVSLVQPLRLTRSPA
jgi:hypothetical protein